MQRGQVTITLAIVMLLLALVCPWTLAAQEEQLIDCRGARSHFSD